MDSATAAYDGYDDMDDFMWEKHKQLLTVDVILIDMKLLLLLPSE